MNFIEIHQGLTFNIVYASLLWVRLLAVTATIPFLFGKPVPKNVRVAAAFLFMMFLFPHLRPTEVPEIIHDPVMVALLFVKEALVGLVVGLGASMVLYGFDGAGRMIDNQRGMSLARILIPQLNEMGSITGNFLFQLSIVVFLIVGGHRQFFDALFSSYISIPIFVVPDIQASFWPLMKLFMIMTGQVIILSVQIAAPVILSILMADIILAVANRIAPQINVWEMGFNIKGYLGILMLFVSITMVVKQMGKQSLLAEQQNRWAIELLQGKVPEPLRENPEKVPSETPVPETPDPTLAPAQ